MGNYATKFNIRSFACSWTKLIENRWLPHLGKLSPGVQLSWQGLFAPGEPSSLHQHYHLDIDVDIHLHRNHHQQWYVQLTKTGVPAPFTVEIIIESQVPRKRTRPNTKGCSGSLRKVRYSIHTKLWIKGCPRSLKKGRGVQGHGRRWNWDWSLNHTGQKIDICKSESDLKLMEKRTRNVGL